MTLGRMEGVYEGLSGVGCKGVRNVAVLCWFKGLKAWHLRLVEGECLVCTEGDQGRSQRMGKQT